MILPLSILDFGLLSAVIAIILLLASEIIFSLPDLSSRLPIDRERLRFAAIAFSLSFIVTIAGRVLQLF